MKKITALGLLLTGMLYLHAQEKFPALQFSSAYPQALRPLSFSFNRSRSPFKSEKNIRIYISEVSPGGVNTYIPFYTVSKAVYRGNITPALSTALVLICIKSAENKLPCKVYFLPVYGKNRKPVKEYYEVMEKILADPEEFLFDPDRDLKGFPFANEKMGK
ncbi:MAG: hypothetical protein WKF88_06335 [Ferruginibacter sp.]